MSEQHHSGLSANGMADLAHAGLALLSASTREVNYYIHYGKDQPGYLDKLLSSATPRDIASGLCVNVNGVALIITTDFNGPAEDPPGGVDSHSPVFVDSNTPSPAFLYDAKSRFEVLVGIGQSASEMNQGFASIIAETTLKLGHAASVLAKAPLLSIQCPVQIPSGDHLSPTWPESSSIAVRAAFALDRGDTRSRAKVAESLAKYCRDKGLGFWVGSGGPLPSYGNWRCVVKPPEDLTTPELQARLFELYGLPKIEDARTSEKIVGVLPVTFVGPPRVGSTYAILSLLSKFPTLGVTGMALAAMNDLAFIHVQLASRIINDSTTDKKSMDELRRSGAKGLEEFVSLFSTAGGQGPVGLASMTADSVESLVNGSRKTSAERLILDLMSGYKVYSGPVMAPSFGAGPDAVRNQRKAIWFSWRHGGERDR
jgi:hypothetical protein